MKPPCLSCEHAGQSKNDEPCPSCKRPAEYDASICDRFIRTNEDFTGEHEVKDTQVTWGAE
jgi:hypothetical protein